MLISILGYGLGFVHPHQIQQQKTLLASTEIVTHLLNDTAALVTSILNSDLS